MKGSGSGKESAFNPTVLTRLKIGVRREAASSEEDEFLRAGYTQPGTVALQLAHAERGKVRAGNDLSRPLGTLLSLGGKGGTSLSNSLGKIVRVKRRKKTFFCLASRWRLLLGVVCSFLR